MRWRPGAANLHGVLRVHRIPHSTNVERVALAAGHKGLAVNWVDHDPADRTEIRALSVEPTDAEREQGLKVATAAHRAIAQLVRDGYVRVIVTTNFDRLMEHTPEICAENLSALLLASEAGTKNGVAKGDSA